jgi:hypothetical protein
MSFVKIYKKNWAEILYNKTYPTKNSFYVGYDYSGYLGYDPDVLLQMDDEGNVQPIGSTSGGGTGTSGSSGSSGIDGSSGSSGLSGSSGSSGIDGSSGDNKYLEGVTVNNISDVDFLIANGVNVESVDFSHGLTSHTDVTEVTDSDDGKKLTYDLASRMFIWNDSGGITSPAGSDGQVQYNNEGVFGADDNYTWNKTTNILSVNGRIDLNDGGGSVFIGTDSGGYDDGTDNKNVFIGNKSGSNNTEGYKCIFIGNESGRGNSTGFNNINIGDSSGKNNTIGFYNINIGNNSGIYNNNGDSNINIGNGAGFSNKSGHNMFIGVSAGTRNTDGSRNCFIGNSTGFDNTIGYDNTFLGNSSGIRNIEGNNNLFLGLYSSMNNTIGNHNIIIGSHAGVNDSNANNNETSNYTILIGSWTQVYTDGDENEIVIGYNAIGKGSNTVLIGNDDITDTYLGGRVHINDAYTLPNVDGDSLQILQTDGSGVVSWVNSLDEKLRIITGSTDVLSGSTYWDDTDTFISDTNNGNCNFYLPPITFSGKVKNIKKYVIKNVKIGTEVGYSTTVYADGSDYIHISSDISSYDMTLNGETLILQSDGVSRWYNWGRTT